jgi:hypothetical protein
VDERGRRVGLNEAVFREVNERLEELAAEFQLRARTLELVCECGNIDCDERIEVSPDDYERLRADPTTFAVVHGHGTPDLEQVVERRAGYDVIQKRAGDPTELARDTDARS